MMGLEEFEAASKVAMAWGTTTVNEQQGVANNFGNTVSILQELYLAGQHQALSGKERR